MFKYDIEYGEIYEHISNVVTKRRIISVNIYIFVNGIITINVNLKKTGKCCMLGVIIYRVDLPVIANLKVAMNFKIKPFGVFINLFNVVRTIANTHRTRKEVYLRH